MNKLTFISYPSCTSCRKTKKWLNANSVEFNERHIFRETPTFEEMMHLLSMTNEGIDEILATRSQTFKDLKINVDDMTLSEVVKLLVDNPKLLRRPILTDGEKLVIGYNPEGLRNLTNRKNLLKLSC